MSSEQRDDVLPLTWAVGNEYEANWRSIWIHFKSNQIRIEETPEGILHITTRKKDVTEQSGGSCKTWSYIYKSRKFYIWGEILTFVFILISFISFIKFNFFIATHPSVFLKLFFAT